VDRNLDRPDCKDMGSNSNDDNEGEDDDEEEEDVVDDETGPVQRTRSVNRRRRQLKKATCIISD
jgi:hypothetical protein